MIVSLGKAIKLLYPEGEWTIENNNYAGLNWLSKDIPKPTEEQIQAKIEELEAAEPLRLLRLERDARIAKTDWRATVDYPGTDQEAWLTYRQALRDLPATAESELDENGMLTNVTWPEEPV